MIGGYSPYPLGLAYPAGWEYSSCMGSERISDQLERELESFTHYRRSFGISNQDYLDRVECQHGRCAMCGRKAKLLVDHDHLTMVVRGLLCNGCNVWLGMNGDRHRRFDAQSY